MGGCYSATKGKRKENGPGPEPEASELPKELPTKEATLEVAKSSKEETTPEGSLPKEVIISEVVTTTFEVSIPPKEECTSGVVVEPVKDAAIEVSLTPNEEDAANFPKEEIGSEVTVEANITTDKVTMEATKLNVENDVKEAKKHEDEVENTDGEKVVVLVDESKLIEKKTLDEESGTKVDEAEVVASKEDQKESKCVETKKEDLKVVEEQETEKQSPA